LTQLHVPGDFVDLHSFLVKPIDHSIVSISTCKLASVSHERLADISDRYPRLARLLWLTTLIDGGTHRRWSFCLGSLQAHQHLAHLFCELYLRLQLIGQVDEDSFHIPMTQGLVAECLAISFVHANRAVQRLRGEGVVSWERDLITIKDWDTLTAIAEFDPTYLRISAEARAYSVQ
jgi:CRP-like cAMP-binding protein